MPRQISTPYLIDEHHKLQSFKYEIATTFQLAPILFLQDPSSPSVLYSQRASNFSLICLFW